MFILLTDMYGKQVCVNICSIADIREESGRSVIHTGNATIYVKESFDSLVEQVMDADKRNRR
jgi:uncharacterized protein YlzI (FlbEa/FlbD family)